MADEILRAPVLAWLRRGRLLGGTLPLADVPGLRLVTDVELGQALTLNLVRVHESVTGKIIGFKLTQQAHWYLARLEAAETLARAAAERGRAREAAAREVGS